MALVVAKAVAMNPVDPSDTGQAPVAKKKRAPRYIPTQADRLTVTTMAAVGISQNDIAKCIGKKGISIHTLRNKFARELETSKIQANSKVGSVLFNLAVGNPDKPGGDPKEPNVTAAIFWMKTQAGWSERTKVEVTGADGGPLQYSDATDEQIDERILLLAKQTGIDKALQEGGLADQMGEAARVGIAAAREGPAPGAEPDPGDAGE